ncbi:hypothetical protein D9757_013361 [Collybiopsis confluens]|uniref:Uncharacterized protein n=1 Tax=Collybiopsis confluens TaxID=2823264 RepID=A0A8H5FSP1_9AGAR|nr:hypothetical protein D9757_013361 [Collybiopsis confluens]
MDSVYFSYPIFSAAHEDAQAQAQTTTGSSLRTKNTAAPNNYFHEFEAAIQRLQLLRDGYRLVDKDPDNHEGGWVGFSNSRSELCDSEEDSVHLEEAESDAQDSDSEAYSKQRWGAFSTQEKDVPVELQAAREIKRSTLERTKKRLRSKASTGKQSSIHQQASIKWANGYLLKKISLYDLCVMRSGTGRMLFEERVLIYLPFQLPSLHWQTSSIREVFPSVTETVLSAGYLVGRTCRWRYALLLALASTTSTVAPVSHVPNSLISPFKPCSLPGAFPMLPDVYVPELCIDACESLEYDLDNDYDNSDTLNNRACNRKGDTARIIV